MSKGKQKMMMRVLSAFLAAGMSISISGMPVCASEAGSTSEQNEYVLEQAETEEKNADTAQEAAEAVETDTAREAEPVDSEPVSDTVSDETTDKTTDKTTNEMTDETEEPAESVSEESADGRTDIEAAAELEAVAEEDAEEVTVHDEAAQSVAEETWPEEGYVFHTNDPDRDKPLVSVSGGGQWRQNSRGWWYQYANGSYPKNEWVRINGSTYHFDASGYMQTGWQKIDGSWYYFASGGAMQTGWKKISGKWFYFADYGAMKMGWQKISGSWYYFAGNGAMQTGWQKIGGKWYYFASGGAMATGSQRIGGKQQYFKSNGVWVDPNVVVQKVFAGFKERYDYVHLMGDTYEMSGSKEIVFIRRSQGDGVITIDAEVTLETGLVSWVEYKYLNGDFEETRYHFYISIP